MIRRILFCVPFLGVLSGVAISSAYATTITVNTFTDEDGENSGSCSLREAIQASQSKIAYGGCPAGQQFYTDTIQLASGTYQLTRGELVVKGSMLFVGAKALAYYDPDAITGQPFKRLPITTNIVAASGSRIFNTSVSHSDLNLNSINLNGGTADLGGAILAGGTVEFYRVNVKGAKATAQGGAIYLEGDLATLTASASTFTENDAPRGAVLGMSCYDNLKYTTRTIALTQLSMTNNGSATSASTLDFCGLASVSMLSSTLAQNTTMSGGDDVGNAAAIRMIDNNFVSRLSKTSSLSLISNTVTENVTPNGLLYGKMATMTVDSNILAFNSGADCDGTRDPVTKLPLTKVVGRHNLFASTTNPPLKSTSKCVLYDTTDNDDPKQNGDSNVYAASNESLTDFVSPIGYYGDNDPNYYGYLPLADKKLIGKGAVKETCGSTDQRGLPRGSAKQIVISADGIATENIPCDIGAMDLSILRANDNQGGGNTSYVVLAKSVTNTDGLTDAEAAQLTKLNADYRDAYTKSFRYREAVIDITENDFAQEVLNGNSSKIPLLAPPTGQESPYTITGSDVGNIYCEWNPTMKQLLATRKDGSVTPGGQRDSCKYTITSKDDPSKAVTATAWFTISNIPPIAPDKTYTLPFGASSMPIDLLDGSSDDGDGPITSTGYPKGKLPFYQDKRIVDGKTVIIPANIILLTKPTQGHIVAEFEAPCVTNNVNTTTNTCYGGKMTYVNDNLFSPFNDSFTYEVIDSDFAPSNPAKVTIINTATTTDKAKAGGGSLGLGGLLGLMSLALVRRRAMGAKSQRD